MPCPHYSRDENDCRLRTVVVAGEEAREGPEVDDAPADLSLCLAHDTSYRGCTMYRRQVAELLP